MSVQVEVIFSLRNGTDQYSEMYEWSGSGNLTINLPDASQVTKEGCTLLCWGCISDDEYLFAADSKTIHVPMLNSLRKVYITAYYNLVFTFNVGEVEKFETPECNDELERIYNKYDHGFEIVFNETLLVPDPNSPEPGGAFACWSAEEDGSIILYSGDNISNLDRGYTLIALFEYPPEPEEPDYPTMSNIRVKTETGWKIGRPMCVTAAGVTYTLGVRIKTESGWK